jgi:tetratricopeptide (TPR) repeat protein
MIKKFEKAALTALAAVCAASGGAWAADVSAPKAVEAPKTVVAPHAAEAPKEVDTPKIAEKPKVAETSKAADEPKGVVEPPKIVEAHKAIEPLKTVAAHKPAASVPPDDAAADGTVQPSYQPDWSRFEKDGMFGKPASGPVTADENVDMIAAETHYTEILNTDLPDVRRKKALIELADLYHKYNVKPKEAAVYERYIEAFPRDTMVPEIYMRLGFIYRDIGAFHTALGKFYSVLNSSLAVDRAGIEAYKLLSLRAQMEIADTYYMMGDYDQAAKFYMRLKRLDMSQKDRVLVDFKYCYTQYLLKDYAATISSLQAFVQTYPDEALVAEAHFVLACAFRQINQPRSALNEVLSLLQYQSRHSDDAATWSYWKKRAGNQLGNEFYEQGDFESALHIYQAMATISDDPNWLWPSLYQMGLCFERLRYTSKAMDAYGLILKGAEAAGKNGGVPSSLKDIVEQAKWRSDHLGWQDGTQREIQGIIGK